METFFHLNLWWGQIRGVHRKIVNFTIMVHARDLLNFGKHGFRVQNVMAKGFQILLHVGIKVTPAVGARYCTCFHKITLFLIEGILLTTSKWAVTLFLHKLWLHIISELTNLRGLMINSCIIVGAESENNFNYFLTPTSFWKVEIFLKDKAVSKKNQVF